MVVWQTVHDRHRRGALRILVQCPKRRVRATDFLRRVKSFSVGFEILLRSSELHAMGDRIARGAQYEFFIAGPVAALFPCPLRDAFQGF